jgi:hypothetical protein
MPLAAVQSPYILIVLPDDDPINPRKDYDPFGHMACWHRRYNLGDEHDYEDSKDLFRDLANDSVSPREVLDYVKSGKSKTVRLEYNRSAKEWELHSLFDGLGKWYVEYTFSAPLVVNDVLKDSLLEELSAPDLKALAEKAHIIKPLYLYDHSGIRMSTDSFIGRAQHAEWDSGQVGWIYASYKDIEKEYGSLNPETIERADRLLDSEVKTYDAYISGQCYGFQLYKDGEEIDSCWGFLGDTDKIKESIIEHLEEGARGLVDDLDYTDTAVEEILMEESEYEDEI